MTAAVWKWPVPVQDEPFRLMIPPGTEMLTVQAQDVGPGAFGSLWGLVPDVTAEPQTYEERTFVTCGTGTGINMERRLRYVGTFQQLQGALVWHLFEVGRG